MFCHAFVYPDGAGCEKLFESRYWELLSVLFAEREVEFQPATDSVRFIGYPFPDLLDGADRNAFGFEPSGWSDPEPELAGGLAG
jgi:hypothetical protein